MPRHFECTECGRRLSDDNLKGVRILQACPTCDDVTTHDRVDADTDKSAAGE